MVCVTVIDTSQVEVDIWGLVVVDDEACVIVKPTSNVVVLGLLWLYVLLAKVVASSYTSLED